MIIESTILGKRIVGLLRNFHIKQIKIDTKFNTFKDKQFKKTSNQIKWRIGVIDQPIVCYKPTDC